ncbi:hypothetical protein BH23VER1_BH23VER1_27720 [soil metagenome]
MHHPSTPFHRLGIPGIPGIPGLPVPVLLASLILCLGTLDLRSQEAPDSGAERGGDIPSSAATVAATHSMDVLDRNRLLNIGDLLSYRVVEDKGRVSRLIVTDSGEMEVPLIGRVVAKGKTCYQIAHEIKATLEKQYYKQATVILALDFAGGVSGQYATAAVEQITLMGEVGKPGRYPLPQGLGAEYTLSQAILEAGGFGRFANTKKVKVVRRLEEGDRKKTKTIIVNLRDVMEKGELEKDLVLQPHDVIIVPEKIFNF